MRVDRLRLIAYGPFTGRELDLSSGAQGLHVIFGPNEAGKSSALRAPVICFSGSTIGRPTTSSIAMINCVSAGLSHRKWGKA